MLTIIEKLNINGCTNGRANAILLLLYLATPSILSKVYCEKSIPVGTALLSALGNAPKLILFT